MCILLAMLLPGVVLRAQSDPSAHVTSPASGQVLFGVIPISGTASNPTMQSYRIEYQLQGDLNAPWQLVTGPVTQQVTNGVLGQWDTTKIADGIYQLRLRVTLRNATVLEDYARALTVANQQPTPLPTLPPAPTATSLPTSGPTPTQLIQQPPTLTPRIAPIVAPPTDVPPTLPVQTSADNTSNVAPDTTTTLSFAAIQSAVCGGAFIAVIGFIALGVYGFIRERMRRGLKIG